MPQATYFVRAYSMCGANICAYGNSTGFFQVSSVPPDFLCTDPGYCKLKAVLL